MSTGKTYSTKYLLDSNNNRGSEGQILSTTSTGIDWVDANTVPGTVSGLLVVTIYIIAIQATSGSGRLRHKIF